MNRKHQTAAGYLLIASLFLSACGPGQLFGPTFTPTPTTPPRPTHTFLPPTATPEISYAELARQAGFIRFEDNEKVEGVTFSFWMPEPYTNTFRWQSGERVVYWQSGEFLTLVSETSNDYAYDIYAENTLFTGSDTSFYWGSPHANECTELKRKVDVGRVEFALRTGQDLQLENMAIANYAGLLANAIQAMRGDQWSYEQSSEPFYVPGFEAWRIISDFAPSGRDIPLSNFSGGSYDVTFIDYILKEGDRIWVLTFSVDTPLFWEESACSYLTDDFDLIAHTFEVYPKEK